MIRILIFRISGTLNGFVSIEPVPHGHAEQSIPGTPQTQRDWVNPRNGKVTIHPRNALAHQTRQSIHDPSRIIEYLFYYPGFF